MLKVEATDAESKSDTAQTIEIPIINRKEKVNNEPEEEMKALVSTLARNLILTRVKWLMYGFV